MLELLCGGRDGGNEEKTQKYVALANKKDRQNINDTVLAPKG